MTCCVYAMKMVYLRCVEMRAMKRPGKHEEKELNKFKDINIINNFSPPLHLLSSERCWNVGDVMFITPSHLQLHRSLRI